jgi:hypothetical protein
MKLASAVIEYILLPVAAWGALEWVLSQRISAILSVAGWLMLIAVVFTFAVATFTSWRPAASLIRCGRAASIVGIVIWLASGIIDLRVRPSASEEWRLGHGEVSHTQYRTTGPPIFPTAPDCDLRLDPEVYRFPVWLLPLPSYISLGDFRGGSSRTYGVGTWPLAAGIGFPTLVLARLRRTRLPVTACRKCGYSLIGNVSGRCPECGTRP